MTDSTVTRKGPGLEQACLGPSSSMCVLTSFREDLTTQGKVILKFLFIEAWNRETQEGFRGEEATGESPGGALLWLPRNVTGKK